MKKFSLANEEQIFVKKETVEGTLVFPSATDRVLAVGAAATNQDIEFIDDAQVRSARSRAASIKGRTNAGAWSFRTYVKPSGVLGTPPECDVLMECLMGQKTVPSGVLYEFDSSLNLPSFSLLRKVGHTVFYMAGCTVNQGEFTVSGAEIASIAWSGQFMKWYYAGESPLTTGVTGGSSTVLAVNDATRFLGSNIIKVMVATDDNAGAGYLVTAVNWQNNTLTITPAIVGSHSTGAMVKGFYPTTSSETGQPVHGKLGVATIDTKNAIVLSGTITVVNNVKYYTDEKNNRMYPTVYGATGFRDVTGTLRLYFYRNTSAYFYRSEYQVNDALILPAGNVAGKIMEISCPKIEYRTPTISGDEEIMLDLNFRAIANTAAGDDEMTVTFK